jgi:hypothetical protein
MPMHQAVFYLGRAQVNVHHLRGLIAAINTPNTGPARALDQFLVKFAHRQGLNRALDSFATDVSIFKTGNIHAVQLAGNQLRRKEATQ